MLNMNILIWNCWGALNPTFKNVVIDLVQLHSLAIMIVTETKVGDNRAKEITSQLPFDGAIISSTIGLTGGLWLLWDSSRVEIAKLSYTEQEIHVTISCSHTQPWLLSIVCANPRYAEQRLLWENLSTVASFHSFPWVIAGDFNEVLLGEDKFGGRNVNINRALKFQKCLNNYKMIDIGFSGPRYTLSNLRPLSQLI